MKISLIWGMDRHRLIGKGDGLPWKLPADMQWFRQQTMAKPLLMGRKTYATIGRSLAERLNIVLTRQTDLSIDGFTVAHILEGARAAAGNSEELMVNLKTTLSFPISVYGHSSINMLRRIMRMKKRACIHL